MPFYKPSFLASVWIFQGVIGDSPSEDPLFFYFLLPSSWCWGCNSEAPSKGKKPRLFACQRIMMWHQVIQQNINTVIAVLKRAISLKNEEHHQGGSCEPYEWQLETVPGNVARMHPMLWEPRTTMARKGRRDTTFIPPLAAGCINVRKKHSPAGKLRYPVSWKLMVVRWHFLWERSGFRGHVYFQGCKLKENIRKPSCNWRRLLRNRGTQHIGFPGILPV